MSSLENQHASLSTKIARYQNHSVPPPTCQENRILLARTPEAFKITNPTLYTATPPLYMQQKMAGKRGASSPFVKDATPKKQKMTSAFDDAEATVMPPTLQNNAPIVTPDISAASQNQDTPAPLENENNEVTPKKKARKGPKKGKKGTPAKDKSEDAAATEHEDAAATEDENVVTTPKNKGEKGEKAATPAKGKKSSPKNPPVGDGFDDWPEPFGPLPDINPFWGVRPLPGHPRPDPIQPAARESDGAVNPPLWEDRKYRFKRGSRYVKYFYRDAPDNVDELEEDKDQEDLLYIKLMDMRPVSNKDPTPKRQPHKYCYKAVPKDWNNMQSIKALNDRYFQAINRITLDPRWSRIEREYLAELLREFPDASIWELTERHNDRFMGKDYRDSTGFPFASLSTGRTVESVRYEYTQYKPSYDRGEAPKNVRDREDITEEAKRIRERMVASFGAPRPATTKKPAGSKHLRKNKKEQEVVEESEDEEQAASIDPFAGQPSLEDPLDQELFELAFDPIQQASSPVRQSTPLKGSSPKSASASSRLSSAPSSPLSPAPAISTPTDTVPPKRMKPTINQATEDPPKHGVDADKVVKETVVEETTVQRPATPDTATRTQTQTNAIKKTETKAAAGKRVTSTEASRKIEIDEDYDDEDEEL